MSNRIGEKTLKNNLNLYDKNFDHDSGGMSHNDENTYMQTYDIPNSNIVSKME